MTKKEIERNNYVLSNCISCYMRYFKEGMYTIKEGMYTKRYNKARQKGRFLFIPAAPDEILHFLNMITKYYSRKGKPINSLKFLDAGCGIGNVLLFFELAGFITDGIEIDNKNVKTAKKLVPQNIRITKGDILTFKNYSHYDIIYFYHPFYSIKKQEEFEAKVANDAKKGALIIAYSCTSIFKHDSRFKCINRAKDLIWVKIKE